MISAPAGKPRLLIVGPVPPPYIGPAVATVRLVDSSVLKQSFDIDFLDTSDPDGQKDIGRFSLRNVRMALQHGRQCFQLLRDRQIDVMYVPIARGLWGFVRDILFLVPARLIGTRVVVHLRAGRFDLCHDYGAFGALLARFALTSVSRGIVLGESLREVYGDSLDQDRVRVVPNGMDLTGWDYERWAESRRSHSRFSIAYVGNLRHDKGAHVMLEALPAIRRAIPDVKVTFAGKWGSVGYRDLCMKLVAAGDLQEAVTFIDGIDESGKKELLAASDLSVFVPVMPEGAPWVVLEAMSAGLAVVGTPQGTMHEVIVDGETGYIIPPSDPDALARRVVDLARDRKKRERLGREGRARVEAFYTVDVTDRTLREVAIEALCEVPASRATSRKKVGSVESYGEPVRVGATTAG